jgi:bifunctional DNase/RNase
MILDESKHAPVLLLHLVGLERFLPIWIGSNEAVSISMALQNETFERPLTHDLLVTVIDALGGRVARVVVVDQRDNTYYAKIFIERGEQVIGIDARPSDSIAVALRVDAPIYVSDEVVEKGRESLLPFAEVEPGDAAGGAPADDDAAAGDEDGPPGDADDEDESGTEPR